ncbi:MAG: hypothetical protein JNJ58_12875 [Chitinophagaceae bacterium]|nr:hypothetical protein [Chitinophagaceae bacterium]
MKTQLKYDATKEINTEIEVSKIVAVISRVEFHFKGGKIRKAQNATDLSLTMTIEDNKVKFNRKLKFYEY